MQTVKLYVADTDLGKKHFRFLLENVSVGQKEKALRYANEIDQIRSLLSSYLKNQLSREELLKNENGKPYFANGPYFNISHSGKYVLMAVSTAEIGVDIEEIKNKDMSSLVRIFNEAEAKMIKEHSDFYYLWCAKESLIKCVIIAVPQPALRQKNICRSCRQRQSLLLLSAFPHEACRPPHCCSGPPPQSLPRPCVCARERCSSH